MSSQDSVDVALVTSVRTALFNSSANGCCAFTDDDISLALHTYEQDVERTIQAFVLDEAAEALAEWKKEEHASRKEGGQASIRDSAIYLNTSSASSSLSSYSTKYRSETSRAVIGDEAKAKHEEGEYSVSYGNSGTYRPVPTGASTAICVRSMIATNQRMRLSAANPNGTGPCNHDETACNPLQDPSVSGPLQKQERPPNVHTCEHHIHTAQGDNTLQQAAPHTRRSRPSMSHAQLERLAYAESELNRFTCSFECKRGQCFQKFRRNEMILKDLFAKLCKQLEQRCAELLFKFNQRCYSVQQYLEARAIIAVELQKRIDYLRSGVVNRTQSRKDSDQSDMDVDKELDILYNHMGVLCDSFCDRSLLDIEVEFNDAELTAAINRFGFVNPFNSKLYEQNSRYASYPRCFGADANDARPLDNPAHHPHRTDPTETSNADAKQYEHYKTQTPVQSQAQIQRRFFYEQQPHTSMHKGTEMSVQRPADARRGNVVQNDSCHSAASNTRDTVTNEVHRNDYRNAVMEHGHRDAETEDDCCNIGMESGNLYCVTADCKRNEAVTANDCRKAVIENGKRNAEVDNSYQNTMAGNDNRNPVNTNGYRGSVVADNGYRSAVKETCYDCCGAVTHVSTMPTLLKHVEQRRAASSVQRCGDAHFQDNSCAPSNFQQSVLSTGHNFPRTSAASRMIPRRLHSDGADASELDPPLLDNSAFPPLSGAGDTPQQNQRSAARKKENMKNDEKKQENQNGPQVHPATNQRNVVPTVSHAYDQSSPLVNAGASQTNGNDATPRNYAAAAAKNRPPAMQETGSVVARACENDNAVANSHATRGNRASTAKTRLQPHNLPADSSGSNTINGTNKNRQQRDQPKPEPEQDQKPEVATRKYDWFDLVEQDLNGKD